MSQIQISMAKGIYTHYKFLEVENCSSPFQLPLHSRMEAVCSHEAVAGYEILESALCRVWNKTSNLICPPQLSSHTTSMVQVSEGSWGALYSFRIAPVTSTAFLSATASWHRPAVTDSLSDKPFTEARVS